MYSTFTACQDYYISIGENIPVSGENGEDRRKTYYKKNREKARQKNKEYYEKNQDKILAKRRAKYKANSKLENHDSNENYSNGDSDTGKCTLQIHSVEI